MSKIRVVQWSTGGVGRHAIRMIARRPDLGLVGAWVYNPAKIGRDAGELAGLPALGVAATGSIDDVLALKPDCVSYSSSGEPRPRETVDDYCTFLEAGINIVTTSVPGLLNPEAFNPKVVRRIEEACARGGTSLYASGLEPGFVGDHLVLVLATCSDQITSVRTQEIFNYGPYPSAFTIFELFGFGKPTEEKCLMELPGVQTSAWGPPVRLVASRLGVELDSIRETYYKEVTDRELQVAAGTIPAGTVAAVRFETIGVVDGRDVIVIEHVNRLVGDVAPEWPTADSDGGYRIVIEGEPKMQCDLQFGGDETFESFQDSGMRATAARIVNAIPGTCDAKPGILNAVDLPLTLPKNAFA